MKTIVINDNNLSNDDIHKFGNKVRAILLENDKILISHYGGVILLPGGSIDEGETQDEAIIRELKEEIGIDYDIKDLVQVLCLKYYQSNYYTRNNEIINRLITTQYYLGQYNGIKINKTRRTDKEIKDNFHLQLMKIDDLLKTIDETCYNPRKKFFDREVQEVVKVLKR